MVLADAATLADRAARVIVGHAGRAVESRGRFLLVLAGGSTPKAAYRLLAGPLKSRIDWSRVEVFFGDERCVDPRHEHSNYRMASEALLSHVPVSAGAVHRMRGELGPDAAAAAYEQLLVSRFGPVGGLPAFDLVLLGVGGDGHTLSLFPGREFEGDRGRYCVSSQAPPAFPAPERVTLTLEAVASSRAAVFLASGPDKAGAVRRCLHEPHGEPVLPAALARAREGVTWLIDRAAATGQR
jgi:6-phosphogluconolactonase